MEFAQLLADFGVSKRLKDDGVGSSEPLSTATCVGTPAYMSPEQWLREVYSCEVDLWAMAVMLHELLTAKTTGDCCEPELALEELDDDSACDLLKRMLVVDRAARLGVGARGTADVKAHVYFAEIDFAALLRKAVPGPLVVDEHSMPRRMGCGINESMPRGSNEVDADFVDKRPSIWPTGTERPNFVVQRTKTSTSGRLTE